MSYFDETSDLPSGLKGLFLRSKVSLSIADPNREDCPLVGVNEPFCDLSGYGADEVLGRNCRFLQPSDGAGPVRARMRRFLSDDTVTDGKFLIPNCTKQGDRFLNLVYMAKLEHQGRVSLILGSQFGVRIHNSQGTDAYELALKEDLRQLKTLADQRDWTVLGSYDALASSHSMIARLRME